MQRETVAFETSKGNKIVLRTYLTGKEANAIKETMYREMKFDTGSAKADTGLTGQLPGTFVIDQEKKLIEFLCVSINEKTENLYETLGELRDSEYQEVVAKINEIYRGNFTQTK